MKKTTLSVMLAMVATMPTVTISAPAHAQYRDDYRWNGDRNSDWDPARHYRAERRAERRYDRRLTREDRIYRGSNGRYYCRRSDGSTGLVVGAIGGGILGGAIGGDVLGALVGGAAGGLLGRSIDRGQVHCR